MQEYFFLVLLDESDLPDELSQVRTQMAEDPNRFRLQYRVVGQRVKQMNLLDLRESHRLTPVPLGEERLSIIGSCYQDSSVRPVNQEELPAAFPFHELTQDTLMQAVRAGLVVQLILESSRRRQFRRTVVAAPEESVAPGAQTGDTLPPPDPVLLPSPAMPSDVGGWESVIPTSSSLPSGTVVVHSPLSLQPDEGPHLSTAVRAQLGEPLGEELAIVQSGTALAPPSVPGFSSGEYRSADMDPQSLPFSRTTVPATPMSLAEQAAQEEASRYLTPPETPVAIRSSGVRGREATEEPERKQTKGGHES